LLHLLTSLTLDLSPLASLKNPHRRQ
jgi:hypothetical protein